MNARAYMIIILIANILHILMINVWHSGGPVKPGKTRLVHVICTRGRCRVLARIDQFCILPVIILLYF